MTDPTLDPGLANRLRAYAEGGVRPIDPLAIAQRTIDGPAPRRRPYRGLLLLAAVLLVTGAVASGLAGGGRLLGLQTSPVVLGPSPTSRVTAASAEPTATLRPGAAGSSLCATDLVQVLTGAAMPLGTALDASRVTLKGGKGFFLTGRPDDQPGGELWATVAGAGGSRRIAEVIGGGDVLDLLDVSPDESAVLLRTGTFSPSGASNECADLYLVQADGSGATRLTHNGTGVFVAGASMSPNGQRVAYVTWHEVIVADVATGQLVRQQGCSTGYAWTAEVAWAPGGGRFAVDCGLVMVYDASGATAPTLVGVGDFTFSWRDDRHLLVAQDTREPGPGGLKVGTFDVDQSTVTESAPIKDGGIVWVAGSGRFSPDGHQLMLQADGATADTEVEYLVPTVGGTPRPITRPGEAPFAPIWSADGKRFVYETDPGPGIALEAVDLATGRRSLLASLPATYSSGIWLIP